MSSSLCVFVHVVLFVCARVFVFVHVVLFICARVFVFVHVVLFVCACVFVFSHVCACLCACVNVRVSGLRRESNPFPRPLHPSNATSSFFKSLKLFLIENLTLCFEIFELTTITQLSF